MDLIEFIGFIITLIAMSILFGKKASEERHRKRDPEAYEREQKAKKEALDRLYGTILEGHHQREIEEEEPYEEEMVALPKPMVPPIPKNSRPVEKKLKINKKEMVILSTIFGPPKSIRKG